MTIKLLIDMNLPPGWVESLGREGWSSVHWSAVGDPGAADQVIMEWARVNDHVVFTHDLDFGAILAATQAEAPSVIQVRAQDIMPEHLAGVVAIALRQHAAHLERGALIVLDESSARVRVLPLTR